MEQIKISLSEVADIASAIRSYNQRLDETLSYVNSQMSELNSDWNSEGALKIQDNFKRFAKKFTEEYQAIESYAEYLEHVVASYDSTESVIFSNASNF